MVYAASNDPLCYTGTNVLRNKLNLHDQDLLAEFELALSMTRAEEPWPSGDLGFLHYLQLHHHLFQDVYDWAGQIRSIRIGKGGNWFCYPEYIESEMLRIFANFQSASCFSGLGVGEFRIKAAHLIAEINAVHPFRDGNGRTQLGFLSLVTERSGFRFETDALDPDKALHAMIESFYGRERELISFLEHIIR